MPHKQQPRHRSTDVPGLRQPTALPPLYSVASWNRRGFLSYPYPPICHPRSRAAPMSSPTSPVLQQLHDLDTSSPDFHDQLCNIFYGEEYVQCAPHLQHDDVVWLVDYLDTVRRYIAFPTPRSTHCRFSMVSILLALHSGNVYACLEAYAAPGRYFQNRTRFRPTF